MRRPFPKLPCLFVFQSLPAGAGRRVHRNLDAILNFLTELPPNSDFCGEFSHHDFFCLLGRALRLATPSEHKYHPFASSSRPRRPHPQHHGLGPDLPRFDGRNRHYGRPGVYHSDDFKPNQRNPRHHTPFSRSERPGEIGGTASLRLLLAGRISGRICRVRRAH